MKLLNFLKYLNCRLSYLCKKHIINNCHIIYKGISCLNTMKMELKPKKKMLNQSYVCKTKKQHCTSVVGLKLWNGINNNLKNSHSVLKFKKVLKTICQIQCKQLYFEINKCCLIFIAIYMSLLILNRIE